MPEFIEQISKWISKNNHPYILTDVPSNLQSASNIVNQLDLALLASYPY